MNAFDGDMRLVDETLQSFGQPVIAASCAAQVVHSLLDDGPVTIIGDDEPVQIEVKTILDRGAIHLRDQSADVGER